MISIRLFLVIPLLFNFSVLHALPWLPRPSRLFGIAVPPDVRYGSEGRHLIRLYQLQLLPVTAGALLAASWLPLETAARWMLLLILVAVAGAGWMFHRARAEARRFALPAPALREARLTGDGGELRRRLPWFLPAFGLLAAAALYLRANWDRIPERFPIHWGIDGRPNGWSHRTLAGVYGPLLLGAILILFIIFMAVLTYTGSRRQTQRSTTLTVLIASGYLLAIVFALAGLSPLYGAPLWAVLTVIIAFPVVIGVIMIRAAARPEPDSEPGEINPDACWHAGEFYYNPDDPALFVEKRVGIGYTFNFARRASWLILGATVLFLAGFVLLAFKLASR